MGLFGFGKKKAKPVVQVQPEVTIDPNRETVEEFLKRTNVPEDDIRWTDEWKNIFNSLKDAIQDLVKEGKYFEALKECNTYFGLRDPMGMGGPKEVTRLFLMAHHQKTWYLFGGEEHDVFVDEYARYSASDMMYYEDDKNYYGFLADNLRAPTFEEECRVLFIVDKYIELHNGGVPTNKAFFFNLNNMMGSMKEEDFYNPSLAFLDLLNTLK